MILGLIFRLDVRIGAILHAVIAAALNAISTPQGAANSFRLEVTPCAVGSCQFEDFRIKTRAIPAAVSLVNSRGEDIMSA